MRGQPKGALLHGFPHSRALRLRRKERKKEAGSLEQRIGGSFVWAVQGSPSTENAVADFSSSSSGAVDVLDYGM